MEHLLRRERLTVFIGDRSEKESPEGGAYEERRGEHGLLVSFEAPLAEQLLSQHIDLFQLEIIGEHKATGDDATSHMTPFEATSLQSLLYPDLLLLLLTFMLH